MAISFQSAINVVLADIKVFEFDLKELIHMEREITSRESCRLYIDKLGKLIDNLKDSFKIYLTSINEEKLTESESVKNIEVQARYSALLSSGLKFSNRLCSTLDELNVNNSSITSNPPSVSKVAPIKPDLLPAIKLSKFAGDSIDDPMIYFNFKVAFLDLIGNSDLSGSSKLLYLKSYLEGYASKIISHLSNVDENYSEAITLLDVEFLNKEAITDQLFANLIQLNPVFEKSDSTFRNVKLYLNQVKCILKDLQMSGQDLISYTPSHQFISHLIFSKLPSVIKIELTKAIGQNYPLLEDIFAKYSEVIVRLNLRKSNGSKQKASKSISKVQVVTASKQSSVTQSLRSNSVVANSEIQSKPSSESLPSQKSTEAAVVDTGKNRICKFCSANTHSSSICTNYKSYDDRLRRLRQLKLCEKCMSSKHQVNECPYNDKIFSFNCFKCGQNDHVSPLCLK